MNLHIIKVKHASIEHHTHTGPVENAMGFWLHQAYYSDSCDVDPWQINQQSRPVESHRTEVYKEGPWRMMVTNEAGVLKVRLY